VNEGPDGSVTRGDAGEPPRSPPPDDWFGDFYDEALPIVYGYFLRRCGGRREVAEDLTQEAFMSAIRSLRKGADVEAPLPWIVSIARRRLVDHYRAERRRRDKIDRFRVLAAADHQLADADASPEARLMTALERVPPVQRSALVLRYVDDLPVKVVARLIGKSRRATESLLSRGRRSLREAFEETGDA